MFLERLNTEEEITQEIFLEGHVPEKSFVVFHYDQSYCFDW
jgi:hypothetical protein